jgi:hypothetical protein
MTTVETADGTDTAVTPTNVSPAPVIEAPSTLDTIEPTVIVEGGEEIFDFSTGRKNFKFRLDGDVFEAISDLPALTAMEFGQYANTLDTSSDLGEQAKAVETMFRLVLTKQSADLFISRLSNVDNPIGARAMNSVMMWLMEKYGFRPTAPSEVSSDGS